MKETELIATLAEGWARSPLQENERFASDAEILSLEGRRLAVTVDDYSAEDRLSAGDPALLGWNLVAATVSDLLAVGAVPRFVLNSFVATRDMDAAYLRALAGGMQQALSACGASMAGGDVGTGAEWRFTGFALGDDALDDAAQLVGRLLDAKADESEGRRVVVERDDEDDAPSDDRHVEIVAIAFVVRRREVALLTQHTSQPASGGD